VKVKTEIKGLAEATKGLNNVIGQYPRVTLAGLLEIGLTIQRDSQQHVPVQFGKLKASAYTRKALDNPNAVEIGYTAKYAAAVHENVEMKWRGKPRRKPKRTVYWGPQGEAKFLENAMRRAERGLLRDLASRAKKNVRKK
jgi:hypothetical protein